MFRKQHKQQEEQKPSAESDVEAVMRALSSSQAIIEFKPDGTILTANPNFLAVMKHSLESIQGKHHRLFVHDEEARHAGYDLFWKKLRSGQFVTLQCRRMTCQGDDVWLQASYCPVLNDQGDVVKVIKFATDITERTLREADFEGQIRAIGRAQAVIEFDLQGYVLSANDNFLSTMGYSLNDLVGKHHSIFMPAEDAQTPEYRAFWDSLREGRYVSARCRRKTDKGNFVWLQASYNPIFDKAGNALKVVKYATDITAAYEQEAQLQALIDEVTMVMSHVARGDMTTFMSGVYKSDLAALSDAVNSTIKQLGQVLKKVLTNTALLTEALMELDEANQCAEESAATTAEQTRQASVAARQIPESVSDVVAALEQLMSSISDVSSNAVQAASESETAVGLAANAKTNMQQLAESSEDINAVVKVISSIADQTNLLALNATIEAARAGEAGRGFAVVANEVKELAKETARATEDVTAKIAAIQEGSQLAGTAIEEIVSTIASINTTQMSIANTVESQSQVSSDIGRSVDEVSTDSASIETSVGVAASVADETKSRAQSSLAVTRGLLDLSQELGALTSRMKLH